MSNVNRNITLLNISAFLTGMLFCLPIIVLYYQDEIGLTFQDFLIGESIFALTVVVMEVPTGWIADVWGRRKSVLLGCCFSITGFTLLWIANDVVTAIAGQAMLGVAIALKSGSTSALLYDSLLSEGREAEFQKREGFRHGLGLYGTAFSAALGGFIYHMDHHLPIMLDTIVAVVNTLVFFCIVEPHRHKGVVKHNALIDMLDTIRYALHGHREVAKLIFMIAIVFSTTKLFIWAQQPFVRILEIPESTYGLMLAGMLMLAGSAGHFGHYVVRNVQGKKLLFGFLIGVGTICLVSGILNNGFSLAILMTGSLFYGFGWPRIQDSINTLVGSERRATILSTASLSFQILFVPLGLMLGYWEKHHGIQEALIFHGTYLLTVASIIALISFKIRKKALA